MVNLQYTCYRFDAIFTGFFLGSILSLFGIMNGSEAVTYYGEVHQSQWNSNIHTLFMPFTSFGFLLAAPVVLRLEKPTANVFQDCVYLLYSTHYLTINFTIGLVYSALYYLVLDFAKHFYKNDLKYIVLGLTTSTVCLVIQEVVGHQYGGDDPSRAEGVLNAVLYANFYAVKNLIGM